MKKLQNLLVVMSISLFIFCAILIGLRLIFSGFVTAGPILGLMFATFLILLDVLIKALSKKEDFIRRDVRILFWLSSAVMMGFVLILLMTSVKKFSDKEVIERFRKIYYNTKSHHTHYLGVRSMQYPNDNWVMQEIIFDVKPDFIIETGTADGGTALFYATILEKINENGKVITVDLHSFNHKISEFKTWKERVEFIMGSSVSPIVVDAIVERVKGHRVLVTLDSDHSKEHVLKELKLYSPLVSLNSYIVVQDTHLGGHPNHHPRVKEGEGPWEAVKEFLRTNKDFEIDHSREKHLITQNPSGFLRRVK